MSRVIRVLVMGCLLHLVYASSAFACAYDPKSMVTFGCTRADAVMLTLKHQALGAHVMGQWEVAAELLFQAIELENSLTIGSSTPRFVDPKNLLTVKAISPLQQYQVIDSVEVGANVRYATVRSGDGRPVLLFWDRLGRPMKVGGRRVVTAFDTGAAAAVPFTVGVTFGGGSLANGLTWLVSLGRLSLSSGVATAADGLLTLGTAFYAIAPTGVGSTEFLVDLLDNPDAHGQQMVYRNRVIVGADGRFILITRMKNRTFWQPLAYVSYDENGKPVW